MAPPDLPRDRPIPQILHPVEIRLLPSLGGKANLAVLHRLDRGTDQGPHANEPLVGKVGLDHGVAPLTMTDRVLVFLDPDQCALFGERCLDCLPGLEPVEARKTPSVVIDDAVFVENQDRLETMSHPDIEVGRIVGRGHLDCTGPERGIYRIIGNDRDLASHQR